MKTRIYKSYSDFLNRKNKDKNGVSEEFAKNHPNFEQENLTNKSCWNCSDCSNCSRCSDCFDCSHCSDCSDCYRCSRCSNCSRCSDCFDCSGLKNYVDSHRTVASDCNRGHAGFTAPKVKDLNKKVLEVVTKDNEALEMSDWHACETTHCRAGWFVHLAGKDGYKLEKETSTLFAAMQIHKASTGKSISPCEFFVSNEESMKLIKKAAEE